MHRSPRSHRNDRDDRGAVAVEFVLILPCFLMLIFGTVVMGNFLSVKAQTVGLARDGAREAALRQPLPAGTEIVGAGCPTPPDTTKWVTVRATKPVSMRTIPFVPLFELPADETHEVTMRCGG